MIQEFMIISARGDTLLTKNYAGSAVVLRVHVRAFLCLGTLVNSTAFGMLARKTGRSLNSSDQTKSNSLRLTPFS